MNVRLNFENLEKKQLLKILAIGAFAGVLWLTLVRAVLYSPDGVHHHANIAVFIDGERELFEEGVFYEEVASCGGEEGNPLTRVHLHDQDYDLVHVHDGSATWASLFENLGFVLGDKVLYARGEAYVDGRNDKDLQFMLNGEQIRSITGKVIESEDVLLVSYGSSDTELQQQYDQIAQDAAEYNGVADPSACKGSGEDASISGRLKHAIGL